MCDSYLISRSQVLISDVAEVLRIRGCILIFIALKRVTFWRVPANAYKAKLRLCVKCLASFPELNLYRDLRIFEKKIGLIRSDELFIQFSQFGVMLSKKRQS